MIVYKSNATNTLYFRVVNKPSINTIEDFELWLKSPDGYPNNDAWMIHPKQLSDIKAEFNKL